MERQRLFQPNLKFRVRTPEESAELCRSIRENPIPWIEILFGVRCWEGPDGSPGQAEAAEAVFHNQRSAIPSGHSTGKTYNVRVIPPLWLLSHPYSYVIITGASWDAVIEKIFPGMRDAISIQPHIFPQTVLSHTWRWADEWGAVGISPMKATPAQGWHSAGGTLVISDEAAELRPPVFEAMKSLLSSPDDHMVMFGNPTRSEGAFADAIRTPDVWNVLQLNSENSPNVRARRTVVPGLASCEMLESWKREYGEDSPEYGFRVLGRLPDQGEMIFISLAVVRACGQRTAIPWEEDGRLVMGVDVGWSETGDESVIIVRGETAVHWCEGHRGLPEPKLRGLIKMVNRKFRNRIESFQVDASGIGSGLADNLLADGLPTIRVIGGARAHDSVRYFNERAECWGRMKAALDYLAIPKKLNGYELLRNLEQAATLEYHPSPRGQIKIEPKPDYQKRTLKHSPDWPDALAYTFAREVGEEAFPMAGDHHQMIQEPSVYRNPKGGWFLHIEGSLALHDRPGFLVRATWFSRASDSASLVAHVDEDGAWTVLRCVTASSRTLSTFWRQVLEMSKEEDGPYDFHYDLASAAEYGKTFGKHHLLHTMSEIDSDFFPSWTEPELIGGMHGVEILDQMLLAGVAPYGDADYWKENPHLKALEYVSEKVLAIYPRDVLKALEDARIKPRPVMETDLGVPPPEGLVGDGPPLVKCLRLIAVSGAAYEFQRAG